MYTAGPPQLLAAAPAVPVMGPAAAYTPRRPGEPLHAVVGPVIGTVTATTARILVEINASQPLTMHVVDPAGQRMTDTQYMISGIPNVFKFSNLLPETMYQVLVPGIQHCRSSFKYVFSETDTETGADWLLSTVLKVTFILP